MIVAHSKNEVLRAGETMHRLNRNSYSTSFSIAEEEFAQISKAVRKAVKGIREVSQTLKKKQVMGISI